MAERSLYGLKHGETIQLRATIKNKNELVECTVDIRDSGPNGRLELFAVWETGTTIKRRKEQRLANKSEVGRLVVRLGVDTAIYFGRLCSPGVAPQWGSVDVHDTKRRRNHLQINVREPS